MAIILMSAPAISIIADDHEIVTIKNDSAYDLVITIVDKGETAVSSDGKTKYSGSGGNQILIGAKTSQTFKKLPIGGVDQALTVSLKQGDKVISQDVYAIWKNGNQIFFGQKPVVAPNVNVNADEHNIISISPA